MKPLACCSLALLRSQTPGEVAGGSIFGWPRVLEWGGDLEGRTRGSLFSLKSPTWGSGRERSWWRALDPLKAREGQVAESLLKGGERRGFFSGVLEL